MSLIAISRYIQFKSLPILYDEENNCTNDDYKPDLISEFIVTKSKSEERSD